MCKQADRNVPPPAGVAAQTSENVFDRTRGNSTHGAFTWEIFSRHAPAIPSTQSQRSEMFSQGFAMNAAAMQRFPRYDLPQAEAYVNTRMHQQGMPNESAQHYRRSAPIDPMRNVCSRAPNYPQMQSYTIHLPQARW